MKRNITIPASIYDAIRLHLFQNEIEQAVFLFAQPEALAGRLTLVVEDFYPVPPRGWEIQMEVYLQMRDSERAKIMKLARDKGFATIDCHSHPRSGDDVWFSPSDIAGITEFSQYARWKLDAKPFAAIVWGERSLDAVLWEGDFTQVHAVDKVQISGSPSVLIPNGSWFKPRRKTHRFSAYE
jgi:hypothetical protein